MGRKCQVQKNRANSHSKFSQTITIKAMEESKTIRNNYRDKCEQCWQQCKNTHTIQTICRQCTDEMGCPTRSMAHSSFPTTVIYSPHSIVPWTDRIVENWWSLEKQFLHIFKKLEKDLEIQAPNLADRWKSGVWLGKSDLTNEHLVRTDDGVMFARSVRRLAENNWSEENLKAVVETHRSRGR